MQRMEAWFARQGWQPFDYQIQAWQAFLDGREGLIHAPTGVGKTYAAWGGPLIQWLGQNPPDSASASAAPPLRVLWITPLRALATDTLQALAQAIQGLDLPWTLELRTSDTSSSIRRRQQQRLPSALVTTPESLCLLLSYPDVQRKVAGLTAVVVDEWHELVGSKRGVQVQLALAQLRWLAPGLRIWGLSATLGNLEQAMRALIPRPQAPQGGTSQAAPPLLIHADMPKRMAVQTLRPSRVELFPWAGHLGLRLLDQAIAAIDKAQSTLVFTNTRSQAEIWFQALLRARTDWIGRIALHHGSLSRDIRQRVEQMLRDGSLHCVVCTSSLDLGVDFSPVDQVIQIGSPKGVARFMQRAGRSGHRPGAASRILGLPTHALELVEFSAVRTALEKRHMEDRLCPDRPLDVLAQHLVTLAAGDGFEEHQALAAARSTAAFADLSDQQWQWTLDFVSCGGQALHAYPQYARVVRDQGRCRIASGPIQRLHRMSIGTIVSDAMLSVALVKGRALGQVEESFVSRMKPGDRFVFAGRLLEFVRLRNMVCYVRPSRKGRGVVPRWLGGSSPLSTELSLALRGKLDEARRGIYADVEMRCVRPILELQQAWSILPALDELLIESVSLRDGHHLFVFPFDGRLVHQGLAALVAYRLSRAQPRSIAFCANDYGFELLSPQPLELDESAWRDLLTTQSLLEDLPACLNAAELARGPFRQIARVAGLVFPGFPGQGKTQRQLQASSQMFFDVFSQFDMDNLLLEQARREALDRELEGTRLRQALERLQSQTLRLHRPSQLTPLAFPLWAQSLRSATISSETWSQRVQRMIAQLEARAHATAPAARAAG